MIYLKKQGAKMYQEIKDYLNKRGQNELLKNCVEKIHYTNKGIEFYCGSTNDNVILLMNLIEEGICDGDLKKSGEVFLESGKGLTTWLHINKREEEEEE